ncbi:hypothetical protein HDU76_003746 [Blyttiomyces sp. JEL0837]|nr:hypothetical protein HDU76_003746 [Blyttiomyces sp. JEL0837]
MLRPDFNGSESPVSAIVDAVRTNSLECFMYLLNLADDNENDMKSLMQVACESGSIKCVEILLAMGAAVEPEQARFKALGFTSSSTITAQKQLFTSVLTDNDWNPLISQY